MGAGTIEANHFRHFSLNKERRLYLPSITVVLGQKKLIILPTLTPPKGYADTRYCGPNSELYNYTLAGKILEPYGNIPISSFDLTNKDFTDPSTVKQLEEAVNNGKYWKYMQYHFEHQHDPKTDSVIPSEKKEIIFIIPELAYPIDKPHPQPLPDFMAMFGLRKIINKNLPTFKIA